MSAQRIFSGLLCNWHSLLAFLTVIAIALHFILDKHYNNFPLFSVFLVGGLPLIAQIMVKSFKGNMGADTLGAIELIVAVILGQYLAAALIVLMLAGGQALEKYAMHRASSVLQALAMRMPSRVHRKKGDFIEDIAVCDIQIADSIIIYPHETCPVDGTVSDGHGTMDESYLTGEPYHVSKAPGAFVLSGAINGEAALTVLADKLPKDSRYAQIMEVMEEAEQKRPRLRRIGDQIGGIFAIAALLISLVVWIVTEDSLRFLSVLVIATPCPLIIAIPVAIISAISLAAQHGIIIKDPTILERLPTCRTAIFDKTGTLTYGKPELIGIETLAGFEKNSILQMTASIERYSKHPLSSAVLKAAEQSKLALREVAKVSEKPGNGLTGYLDNKEIQVTHRKKLPDELVKSLPPAQAGMECVILEDGKPAAIFHFRDRPRAEGRAFISHLAPAHHFNKLLLVSGDRESEVAYLANLIGIKKTYANQSPEQKIALVQEETKKAPTLFMGDGINDAPALTAATVGIAFGHHSVTAEAAGAVIMESSLIKVDELLHISGTLRHIALQSAIGGMLLSIIGMGFAATGYISPVEGALFQEVIDILAILNALRLTWQSKIEADIKF